MTEAMYAHFSAAQKKYRNKSKKKELETAANKGNFDFKAVWINQYLSGWKLLWRKKVITYFGKSKMLF